MLNPFRTQRWLCSFQPQTVRICKLSSWRQMGKLTGIDQVGIRDDMACLSLSEHLREPDDVDLLRIDHIAQDHARSDTRELIDVTHQKHLSRRWNRFHK